MNLFILRHASAGTRRANPLLDRRRPLDRDGKQDCLQLAAVLNNLKLNFDLIVSSPLKRCLQTAQLLATETGYEARILHSDALAPEASFAEFTRLLDELRDRENLLVVGHNPTLQHFLGALLLPRAAAVEMETESTQQDEAEMRPSVAAAQVRLRKGSLARLSLTRGPATLQLLLDPRLVRALYTTSTKSSRRKISRK